MRTVDPELWSRKVRRPRIQVTRHLRFGQQVSCGLEARLRGSLRDAAREFWQNSSLAAAKLFNIDRVNKYERWWHIAVFLLTLALGCAVMARNAAVLQAWPLLVVNLQTTDYPATSYKFPAVALCSNSIISRAALENYSRYLYAHPKNRAHQYRESEIRHNLLDLGALLTLALPPIRVEFDQFLRDVEPDFNVTDIMYRLSSNCSKILLRCSWRGDQVDCASLFASRLTPLGFCCVFNSRYHPVDADRKPFVLDLMGQDYGLGVVVKEERDDFAFVRRPAYGMELLLFEGEEYPLVEGGDVRMYPLPRNSSLYFNIRTFTQLPASEVSSYSEERRGCRSTGGGMSWCLWACRRATAQALCGCAPFALQPHRAHEHASSEPPTCTLSELACLNKHREKFIYLYPGGDGGPALREETQDGMDCPDCRVLCRRQLYFAESSYSQYESKSHSIFRNFLSQNLSLINGTTIRLFYNVDHQQWYKLEVFTRWSDAFVKLSTQWMVLTGVSILSFSELVYYFTVRWAHHFRRRTRAANLQPLAIST